MRTGPSRAGLEERDWEEGSSRLPLLFSLLATLGQADSLQLPCHPSASQWCYQRSLLVSSFFLFSSRPHRPIQRTDESTFFRGDLSRRLPQELISSLPLSLLDIGRSPQKLNITREWSLFLCRIRRYRYFNLESPTRGLPPERELTCRPFYRWGTLNPDGEETWDWDQMNTYTKKAETYT